MIRIGYNTFGIIGVDPSETPEHKKVPENDNLVSIVGRSLFPSQVLWENLYFKFNPTVFNFCAVRSYIEEHNRKAAKDDPEHYKYITYRFSDKALDFIGDLYDKYLEKENRFGIMSPLDEFSVPGLKPYQSAFVQTMSKETHFYLADDMGTGKTCQAISWLEDKGLYPCLIVCPKSIMLNWKIEFGKWSKVDQGKIYILRSGTDPKDLPDLSNPPMVIITSYPAITMIENKGGVFGSKYARNYLYYLLKFKPRAIVGDEAHMCKTIDTDRTTSFRLLSDSSPNVLLMSGTPMPNGTKDMYAPMVLLKKNQQFGFSSSLEFEQIFCDGKVLPWGWDNSGSSNEDVLNMMFKTFAIRREKSAVLPDLPPKSFVFIDTELSNQDQYDLCEKEFIAYIIQEIKKEVEEQRSQGIVISEEEEAALIKYNIIRKISAKFLVQSGELRKICSMGKIKSIVEHVKSCQFEYPDDKIVLFSNYIETQAELIKSFPGCLHIIGDDKDQDRQNAVSEFENNNDRKIIVCSIKAAGIGITLVKSNHLIMCDLVWSPAEMNQAIDRIHRIGQERQVLIEYMIANGSIDDYMLEVLSGKEETIDNVISKFVKDKIGRSQKC